jgi:hypothetical protein
MRDRAWCSKAKMESHWYKDAGEKKAAHQKDEG